MPTAAISPANASQVATIGSCCEMGGVDLFWSADGKTLSVDTASDLLFLDAATLKQTDHISMSAGDGVTVSRDGKLIVAADSAGMQLWNSDGAQVTGIIPGTKNTYAVAISSDGKTIAAKAGGIVSLWNATTGAELQTLNSDSGEWSGLAFSPDGKTLVAGTADGLVEWSTDTWKRLSVKSCLSEPLRILFSPNGKTMAVAGDDGGLGVVRICDPATGNQIRSFDLPEVHGLAFSPDGKIIAGVATSSMTVELWDATSGKKLASLAGHTSEVNAVRFSPDGKILASAGGDGVRLWGVPSGPVPTSAGAGATPVAVASVPQSATAITPANAARVKQAGIWDKANVEFALYTPDGKTLLSFSGTTMHLLDPSTLEETGTIETREQASQGELSNDGTKLAVAAYDGASVWSLDGRRLTSMNADQTKCAVFSPNQKLLVTCVGGVAKVWDGSNGSELRTLPGASDIMEAAAFTPDGKTLVTVDESDAGVGFWNTSTWQKIRAVSVQSLAQNMAMSPDGKTVAIGSFDGITILNVATGATDSTFDYADVVAMAFSPDGGLLASSSSIGGDVILWDVAGHRKAATLAGHTESVGAVTFSPDGATLATGGGDGTLRVWRVGS
jgi:WD40 repeat protein